MTSKIYFCRSCYKQISESGELPLTIYIAICEDYVRSGKVIGVNTSCQHFCQILKFLEQKEYIVSACYRDPYIQVKPKGYYCEDENAYFFCVKFHEQELLK